MIIRNHKALLFNNSCETYPFFSLLFSPKCAIIFQFATSHMLPYRKGIVRNELDRSVTHGRGKLISIY